MTNGKQKDTNENLKGRIKMIEMVINGNPIPQKRHRYRRTSNRIISYDPNSGDNQAFAMQLASKMTSKPFDEPLCVEMIFYMKRPKNHFRTGKYSHKLKKGIEEDHSKKPDVDNLVKFVMDSGNKIVWKDDCCISQLRTMKLYSLNPRTEIRVWKIDE